MTDFLPKSDGMVPGAAQPELSQHAKNMVKVLEYSEACKRKGAHKSLGVTEGETHAYWQGRKGTFAFRIANVSNGTCAQQTAKYHTDGNVKGKDFKMPKLKSYVAGLEPSIFCRVRVPCIGTRDLVFCLRIPETRIPEYSTEDSRRWRSQSVSQSVHQSVLQSDEKAIP